MGSSSAPADPEVRRAETDADLEGWIHVRRVVLPEARRRGVGTALLRELAAHALTLGAPRRSRMSTEPTRPPSSSRNGSASRRSTARSSRYACLREVVTWTQRRNEGMRALNERLGFTTRDVSLTMTARLPLEL
jgi:GNAT superfamily N-acetyltransferase